MSNPIVKVVNKNPDGALVESLDKNFHTRIPWNEFNKYFHPTEQEHMFEMILEGEMLDKVNETEKRIEWVAGKLPLILKLRKEGFSLETVTILGTIVEEYRQKFGMSVFDLNQDVDLVKNYIEGNFAS